MALILLSGRNSRKIYNQYGGQYGKRNKTNAMRILDRSKVKYTEETYTVDEFTDGLSLAKFLGHDPAQSFKTLVTVGKSRNYFVFVIPVAEEVDFKTAAKAVGEKSVEMVPVKRH